MLFFHSLLAPIGQHRSQHIVPSKGKRRRRRAMDQGTTGQESNRSGDESSKPVPPSLAELQTHLTVGFNTTTRYLEALARCSAPNKAADQNPGSASLDLKPLAAVFVPRSDQAPILYSHLPLFVKTASLASPSLPATRLVMLPKGAEKRLAAALSISRVGLIGVLDDTPEAALMIELLRLRVPEVKVPWLVEATTGAYLPVNIKAIQTTTPSETKSSGQRPASLVGDED